MVSPLLKPTKCEVFDYLLASDLLILSHHTEVDAT